ncbi:MAG TPA: SRPBCC family protein [Dehalococcoidia bacterium]|jgi:uncharacterized protein YndB with AHSA1/START domain|nr:SRPBCC family protein [Dehalococcoidia bacterium]
MSTDHETIFIAAPPSTVWATLTDFARWPEWTPLTVAAVEPLDDGPPRVGSRVRIKLRKVPPSVWRVTRFEQGRSFTWETESGVKASGEHTITPEDGGTRVELTATTSGLLAALFLPFSWLTTRGNVRKEAEGLKAYCERVVAP